MNTSHVSPWRLFASALVAASILAATGRAADDQKSAPPSKPTPLLKVESNARKEEATTEKAKIDKVAAYNAKMEKPGAEKLAEEKPTQTTPGKIAIETIKAAVEGAVPALMPGSTAIEFLDKANSVGSVVSGAQTEGRFGAASALIKEILQAGAISAGQAVGASAATAAGGTAGLVTMPSSPSKITPGLEQMPVVLSR